jgi:hypothetical protein
LIRQVPLKDVAAGVRLDTERLLNTISGPIKETILAVMHEAKSSMVRSMEQQQETR